MSGSQLGTFVTYNPLTVPAETTLDRLVEMVEQLQMHDFPVANDAGTLVGIISESAIWRAAHDAHGSGAAGPIRVESLLAGGLISISPHATPRQALELLLKHGIHSLPVLDGGRLLGIVTSGDFLREFSYGELSISREAITGYLRPAGEAIDADATPDQAGKLMQETGRPHVAVVQGGCPIGLVSQADLMRSRFRQPASAEPQTVSGIMRRTPPLRPGQRLSEAAALMVQHQLPALVVSNQANRFLGILADTDILALMLRQLR